MKKSLIFTFMFLLVFGMVAENACRAGSNTEKGKSGMFIIHSKHTKEECVSTLDEMMAKDKSLLGKTEWGCMSGIHEGWTTVSAKSEAAAKEMVPSSMQSKVEVVKVSKFTVDQIKSFHKK